MNSICIICAVKFQSPNPTYIRKICSPECRKKELKERHLGVKRPGSGGRKRTLPLTFNCVVCGIEFNIPAAKIHNQTCSNKCKNINYSNSKGGLAVLTCVMCGKEYKRSRYYIKQGRRFCGDKCRLEWFVLNNTRKGPENNLWRHGGGLNKYGESWYTQRSLALKRDNYTCQHCFKNKDVLRQNPCVHHKTAFRVFGNERHVEANNLSNLISLCRSCHMKIEWEEYKQFKSLVPTTP